MTFVSSDLTTCFVSLDCCGHDKPVHFLVGYHRTFVRVDSRKLGKHFRRGPVNPRPPRSQGNSIGVFDDVQLLPRLPVEPVTYRFRQNDLTFRWKRLFACR